LRWLRENIGAELANECAIGVENYQGKRRYLNVGFEMETPPAVFADTGNAADMGGAGTGSAESLVTG
jgi:hypothetical protein